MSGALLVGHVLDKLREMPNESVQMCVTSPPYLALRDYGLPATFWPDGWEGCLGLEPTVQMFIGHLVDVFREVRRVLRSDGVLFVNIGDSYAGSGKGPTGHNGIGDQERRQGFTGEGAKDAAARAEGAVSVQMARRPGRGIRSGEGYELYDRGAVPGLKPKDLMLVPERLTIAMQDDGWYVRSRIAWTKPSPMPESVQDRPASAWEHVLMFTKSRRYYWDALAVMQPARSTHDSGNGYARPERMGTRVRGQATPWSAAQNPFANLRNVWRIGSEPSRYDYCYGCDRFFLGAERSAIVGRVCPSCGRTDGWVAHYAAFPSELARRCILASTSERGACVECGAPWRRIVERKRGIAGQPAGTAVPAMRSTSKTAPSSAQGVGHDRTWATAQSLGWEAACRHDADVRPCVVLDPFMGSGTTAVAAEHLRRSWVGTELSERYAALIPHRVERDVPRWARPVSVRRQRQPPTPAQMPLLGEAAS